MQQVKVANVGSMLAQRLRRCANNDPTLGRCLLGGASVNSLSGGLHKVAATVLLLQDQWFELCVPAAPPLFFTVSPRISVQALICEYRMFRDVLKLFYVRI